MTNTQDNIRELKERHAAELARLGRECAVWEWVGDRPAPSRVYTLRPRDSLGAAWLCFGDKFRVQGDGEHRTPGGVAALLRDFPPVALAMLKDSCTSIRPDARVSAEQVERAGEYLILEPVTIDFESAYKPLLAHWFAAMGDDIVRIEVVFSVPHALAPRVTGRRVQAPGETYYTDRRVENIPAGWQRIMWATGGREYLGHGTLWAHYDEGRTIADLLTEWGAGNLREDDSFLAMFDVDALAPVAIELPTRQEVTA